MKNISPDQARDWLNDFDHTDPSYIDEIWSVTQDLRTRCPVAKARVYGGFKAISRAEDLASIFKAPQLFISSMGATIPDARPLFPMIPVEIDGKEHLRYRALFNRWLSLSKVRLLEDRIRALADMHLDAFAVRGTCDFVAEFSHPFPSSVLAALMGLPPEDWKLSKAMFDAILAALGSPDENLNRQAWTTFADYVSKRIEERYADPRDDMLSDLAHAEIDGRPLSHQEKVGIAFTFLAAGQDTTANSIGLFVRHLAHDPALKARLLADPALIPDAIEEMLRWMGPVQTVARTAAADTEIGGCPVSKGEKVALLIGSANRDAGKFENGDVYDLDRPNKQDHFAFGHGVHTCAGIHLARLELRIAIERLLARLPDFAPDGSESRHFAGGMLLGLSHLPLRFTPSIEPATGNHSDERPSTHPKN